MSTAKTVKLEDQRSTMSKDLLSLVHTRVEKCFEEAKPEHTLAAMIKDELDKNCEGYGWNVVIGKDFGSYIFHQSKFFAEFKVGEIEVIVWKC